MSKEAVKLYIDNHPFVRVLFSDGITKRYNVTKYAPEQKSYSKLQDHSFFEKCKLNPPYFLEFSSDVDIDVETIYEDGVTVESEPNTYLILLGYEIKVARLSKFLTQMELSKITKINQGDISKLEKGLLNPSVKLLKRITDALEKTLNISISPRTKY